MRDVTMTTWQDSLKKLIEAIPPPIEPKYVDGKVIDATLPTFPEDHTALVEAYGSGEFTCDDIGCVIEVFNPRDPWHVKHVQNDHEHLRSYRESEGEEYLPYPIYPDNPGVLICGWNDSRDYWLWRTDGFDSNQWPTVFYGDLQDAFEFEMPMVVFMQKLFFGEISRQDLSFDEPDFVATDFEFLPTFRTDAQN